MLASPPSARPQDDVKGGTGIKRRGTPRKLTNSNPAPKSTPAPTVAPPRVRVITKEIRTPPKTIYVTRDTGALTIIARPQATVEVENLKNGEVTRAVLSGGERSIIFNDLRPGKYRVSAELVGYKPDQEEVLVVRGKPDKVELNLDPITYDVTIALNAPSGMVYYSKGNEEPDVKPFQNGTALLSDLTPGKYALLLKPDDVAYRQTRTSIEVAAENTRHSIKLDRRETEKEFSWGSAADWNLPGGWFVNSRKLLVVNGRGMALPRDDSFHFYKNFEISTSVRMVNGAGVSFAVRAENAKNYYLIQLTGAKAAERHMLRGYVVRDGVSQMFGRSIPIANVANSIAPGKFFRLLITMRGSDISVKVEDTDTGELLPLGTLSDADNTFRIGAVGLVARDDEQNEFEQFVVCTPKCTQTTIRSD
jgi:hypothetical protein